MTAPLDEKAEHPRIWLEPAGAPDRCWCSENQWGDEGVEYILASEALSAVALPDELEVVAELRARRTVDLAWPEGALKVIDAEQKLCLKAADALSQAHSTIAALRAERDALARTIETNADGSRASLMARVIMESVERLAQVYAAEAEVKRLTEDNEALRAEVARCHARLEIDHVYVADGDELVRREVPMDERLSMPDAVECRDATISILEADARKAMEGGE